MADSETNYPSDNFTRLFYNQICHLTKKGFDLTAAVLYCYIDGWGEEGTHAKNPTLAKLFGISEKTASRHLTKLEKAGEIYIKSPGGKWRRLISARKYNQAAAEQAGETTPVSVNSTGSDCPPTGSNCPTTQDKLSILPGQSVPLLDNLLDTTLDTILHKHSFSKKPAETCEGILTYPPKLKNLSPAEFEQTRQLKIKQLESASGKTL